MLPWFIYFQKLNDFQGNYHKVSVSTDMNVKITVCNYLFVQGIKSDMFENSNEKD